MKMRTVDFSKNEKVRLFNTLAIETGAKCNRSCVFCPVHGNERPDEYMSFDIIRKIAEELCALKWKGRITTYIYNEPFRDKRLHDILRYLALIPRVCLMVSTNGDYLKSKEDIWNIFASGVNQLIVNIYSAQDGNPDPDRVHRGRVLAHQRYLLIKGWMDELGIDQKSSVYIYTQGKCARVAAKYGINNETRKLADYELQNRSGNIDWFKPPLAEPLERSCVRPFRFLNINWQGQGVLCCNDYHGETNFGNVAADSLVEIWNHPALNKYRLYLQNKNRNVALCNVCDYRGGSYPHMVENVTFGTEEDAALMRALEGKN